MYIARSFGVAGAIPVVSSAFEERTFNEFLALTDGCWVQGRCNA